MRANENINTTKGLWVLVTGTNTGGFMITIKDDGVEETFPEELTFEDAIIFSMEAGRMLELPSDHVLVDLKDVMDSVDKSAVVDQAKELIRKTGIIREPRRE
jgi:hypothetical protein